MIRRWGLRTLLWLAVAMVVTWPASLSPATTLIGHPDVDVWNHAWGYWFIPHQIIQAQLALLDRTHRRSPGRRPVLY